MYNIADKSSTSRDKSLLCRLLLDCLELGLSSIQPAGVTSGGGVPDCCIVQAVFGTHSFGKEHLFMDWAEARNSGYGHPEGMTSTSHPAGTPKQA